MWQRGLREFGPARCRVTTSRPVRWLPEAARVGAAVPATNCRRHPSGWLDLLPRAPLARISRPRPSDLNLPTALFEHTHVSRSPCRGRRLCTCRRSSAGRPARRTSASISTPVRPQRLDLGGAVDCGALAASSSKSTVTRVMGSGWHNGTRSAVRLAPWMAAMRAMPMTSPLRAWPVGNQLKGGRQHADAGRWHVRRGVSHPCRPHPPCGPGRLGVEVGQWRRHGSATFSNMAR